VSRDGLIVELDKDGEKITMIKDGKNALTDGFDKDLEKYIYVIPEE